jgi:hypothetical protein
MNNTIRKVAITIGVIAITALSTPAFADRNSEPAYLSEIDSCIAELTSRIDVDDAERVRHVVTRSKRSRLGYALHFDTSVFSKGGESRYSVYCVVKGDSTPVKFRFEERVG